MAPLIAFLAFVVVLTALSLAGVGADSRTYPRWPGASDVDHRRPHAE
jgi:hypothetical protein